MQDQQIAQAIAELMRVGNYADAEILALSVIERLPDDPGIWLTLGVIRTMAGKFDEGTAAMARSLALNDAQPEVHQSMGLALHMRLENEAAARHFTRALELDPNLGLSHRTLGFILLGFGRQREAVEHFRRAIALLPEDANSHSFLIESLDFLPETDVETAQAERKRWNERFVVPVRSKRRPHANVRDPERKLRIGYVSPNFTTHSPTRIFGPVIFNHDKSMFDVICISDTAPAWCSAMTDEFRNFATEWHEIINYRTDQVADLVHALGIDILVDLSGHGMPNRLPVFALKPAPIQITAWGFATGTGLETMDYMFADPVSVPEAERKFFAEKIADLSCVLTFGIPDYTPAVNDLPFSKNGYVTFGCLNRIQKIDDSALALWAEIMNRVPGSKLLLKDKAFDEPGAIERQHLQMAALGIEPSRLVLRGQTDHHGHLAAYNDVDFALDPLAHSGALCTCEALAMGVPTIGLHGTNLTRRQTAAINIGLGLDDFVAINRDDYVAKALNWAGRMDELSTLRQSLRSRLEASPIGNPKLYTRDVEDWYRRMWRTWCETAV